MKILFWKEPRKNTPTEVEVEKSRERLKKQKEKWTEVYEAKQTLEDLIAKAMRGEV